MDGGILSMLLFSGLENPSTFTYTQERGRLHTCPFSFEGIIA